MTSTLWRLVWRDIVGHPWQAILSIVGIGLGVAVVLAIDIVNHSAERAFAWADRSLAGAASDTVLGGPAGLDETVYRVLRVDLGLAQAAPFIEGVVRHTATATRRFKLLGIDPLAPPTDAQPGTAAQDGAWLDLIGVPGSALADPRLVRELDIRLPHRIEVEHDGRSHAIMLIGTIPASRSLEASTLSVLITDIATAQTILGRLGKLSGIHLTLADAHRQRWLEILQNRVPNGATVVPNQARTRAMEELTRAFRVNLTALSLLALVVGGFLIYNTMLMSVIRRHREIGILQCLGVTGTELLRLVTMHALVLGVCGTVLGIGAGIALSHGLLDLVVRTINDLYFKLSVAAPQVGAFALVKSMALGLVVTGVAALAPAYEARRIGPARMLTRSDQERRFGGYTATGWWLGVGVMVAGAVLLGVPSRSLGVGFGGLFLIVLGFALTAPWLLNHAARALERVTYVWMGGSGRVAARGISASLSRSGPAVTALSVAVAATVGVDIMIHSFRDTVDVWLRNYLRADLYVSAPDASAAGIDPGLVAQVRAVNNVRTVTLGRWTTLVTSGLPINLFAVEVDRYAFSNFQLKSGRPEDAWPVFDSEDTVIVSETFAYRHTLGPGDWLTLPTQHGPHRFRVSGVFYDYGTSGGVVVMSRRVYLRHWDDPAITSFAVYVQHPDRLAGTADALERLLAETALPMRSNRALRRLSLEIFDRTFTITAVLRWLMMVIAGIGVFSALTAIQLERAREFGILRALGFTPRGIAGVVTAETGLMGFIAGVLAVPLGLALALALIWVINRRAFGWTMQFSADFESLASGLALAVGAGIAAGAYPAVSLARARLTDVLRHA